MKIFNDSNGVKGQSHPSFCSGLTSNSKTMCSKVFDNYYPRKRPLWNVKEVAQFLNVKEATIRDWVYRREIPFRKVGSLVRFNPEDIERWTLPNKE